MKTTAEQRPSAAGSKPANPRTCVCGATFMPDNSASRFCSLACRFESKVSRDGHVPHLGPCWVWIGQRNRMGYGIVWVDGRTVAAHRVAWELRHGPIPAGDGHHGTCVRHRCDNPACVNPEHMELGTVADNNADMLARGHQVRGEGVRGSKLTWPIVRAIRSAFVAGESQGSIARRLGLTQQGVSRVVRGQTWRQEFDPERAA